MKLTNFAGLMKKQPTMQGGSGEGVFLCLFWPVFSTACDFSALMAEFLASPCLVLHAKWREHATSVCGSVRWIGEVSSRIRWSSFSQCFHQELFLL